jgi:hypothetical protein
MRLLFGFTLAGLPVFLIHAGPPDIAPCGALNATYLIEKQPIHLVDGRAEVQTAPGSAIKITTVVFGKPAYGDLSHDGREDAALRKIKKNPNSILYPVSSSVVEFADRYFCQVSAIA